MELYMVLKWVVVAVEEGPEVNFVIELLLIEEELKEKN